MDALSQWWTDLIVFDHLTSLFLGWPARILAYTCLGFAVWRGIYHQQFLLSLLFFLLSLLFTYGGVLLVLQPG